MSQIKVYGLDTTLRVKQPLISDAIHQALVTSLNYPVYKKFQRFILLEKSQFIYPDDRSEDYLIIEISMFAGRSTQTKKLLIQTIFDHIQRFCGIAPHDVEITIFETPRENWGIRGINGADLELNYKVDL